MGQTRALTDPRALAFAAAAALSLAAAWQCGGAEWFLRLAALLWLTPLAVYDCRHRQVPHLAWVAGPCLFVVTLTAVRGEWALAALALAILAASERWRVPAPQRRALLAAGLLACGGLLTRLPADAFTGAAALLAFWLMFEINWWAGADALAAMTLVLLWPTAAMVFAIGAAHLVWALCLNHAWRWPRPQSSADLVTSGQPGLPALALAAGLHLGLSGLTVAP